MAQLRNILVWSAAAMLLAACSPMTPEERLEKVVEARQQGDLLSAELEARKIVEKFPDDPASITARRHLADIYTNDGRLDEAVAEYQAILDRIPPTSRDGIQILSSYNDLLKRQQRFKEALALLDRYEKELKGNPDVTLNLKFGRADIKVAAGETTEARQLLSELMDETTNPLAQMQFRDLYLQTYGRENNTTGALEFLEKEIAGELPDEVRLYLIYRITTLQANLGNYSEARRWAQEATRLADESLKDELDLTVRTRTLLQLAGLYQEIGNLEGARTVLKNLYETNRDPALGPILVPQLFNVYLRQGAKDEALAFLRDAQKRYPDPQLAQEAARAEDAIKAGKLDLQDTSPLVLQFAAEPVVTPAIVADHADRETTGSTTEASETTAPSASSADSEAATTDSAEITTSAAEAAPEPEATASTLSTEETTETATAEAPAP